MKRTLISIFAMFLLGIGGPSPPPGLVHVTTISCLSDLHDIPALRFVRMNDRKLPHAFLHGIPHTASLYDRPPRKRGLGVVEFDLRLDPGNYEIYADSKRCFGQTMAIVLAGHERHVTLALGHNAWNMLFDHDHSGVAGTIDMAGVDVALTGISGLGTRPLYMEGGAFYADSLQRARWVLRISAGSGREADFPIDLSGVRAGDYATMHLTARDVLSRFDYTGTLFSDPGYVVAAEGVVWYTNRGRGSVGRILADRSRSEISVPGGRDPDLIVADGLEAHGSRKIGPRRCGMSTVNSPFVRRIFRAKVESRRSVKSCRKEAPSSFR